MRRVCVVGAGGAGFEAARESALRGCRVTVAEVHGTPPDLEGGLYLGPGSAPGRLDALMALGVEVEPSAVRGVDPSGRVMGTCGGPWFDSVVIATGRASSPQSFAGWRMPGVFHFDAAGSYPALRDAMHSLSRAVVAGGSTAYIRVADRLADAGVETTFVFDESSFGARLEPLTRARLLDAAKKRGLGLVEGRVERVIGSRGVEAAAVSGRVIPCEAVVVEPDTSPRHPIADWLALGDHGGIVVGDRMQTNSGSVLAAGTCAEFRLGTRSFQVSGGAPSAASGRVAGANASGAALAFEPVPLAETKVFGLRLLCVGLTEVEAHASGVEASSASSEEHGSACSIAFELRSGRVLGVQLLVPEEGDAATPWALALPRGTTLEDLYGGWLGSTDISPVIEAAREGLVQCRRF